MLKHTLHILLALLFMGFQATAQNRTVTGRVASSDGEVLAGATVSLKGATGGTSTDVNGGFSLSVPAAVTTLRFSYTGYDPIEVAIPASGAMAVVMNTSSSTLGEVVISTGSRSNQRTITDSPLPIDILSARDIQSTGQMTFDKALQYRVPSFNTVNTPVNDATALLDPYEIRNMGPSRTLILINGKRKNMSSLCYIQTSPGRGETGVDISAIPTDAIKRVEILRDGASAQYGSDAIAGVMNIILKDKFEYGSVTLNSGITHKGDGEMIGISLNNGANFGEKGFVNYTISLQRQALANRPGTVDAQGEANDFGASLSDVQSFLTKYPDAGNINGQPETSASKFLVNGGIPVGDNTEMYYNAAYVYKKVNSFANYRTPYWRTTDDGLLTPAGQQYIGYVPTFEGDLNDYNGTVGFKNTSNGWTSDVSFTTGGNSQIYTVANSRNRSLGKNSPILFRPGGYKFEHNVGNLDVSRKLLDNLSFAFGSEFRKEKYTVVAGDTASYSGTGADSFPGARPENSGESTRFNFGGYADLGFDITKDFLVNGTARVERYSDFGNAFVWKLSSRYKIADGLATVRGSVSTGFRAPTLHQTNLQIAQASFVPGQGIQTKGIFNNRSAQASLLGVARLKPEESTNLTLGVGLNPTKNLNISVDYYNIAVKNRIILGSEITPTGDATNLLDQVMTNNGIVAISFFSNGINTKTSGLDFVVNYRGLQLGKGKLGLNVAANYTIENDIDGKVINPDLVERAGKSIFDETQRALLFSSRPKYKAILGFDYVVGKFGVSLNNTLFGPTTFRQAGLNSNLETVFKPKVVTDLGFNIQLAKNVSFGLNIQNLLNVMPEWELKALNAAGEAVLADAAAVKANVNAITFNGRYSNVTYDGSHFSQLGLTGAANLTVRF
jgi:iron complex outermembrane recepter protein